MAPKIDRWLEGYVTALSEEKYSYQQIIKRCKNRGYGISKKGMYNILNLKGKKRLAESKNENMTAKPHPKTVRTQVNIKKVKSLILKENPPTQRSIASKLGMSSDTVSKIIHKDLKLKKMFKPKVHLLLPKHIAERKTNCRKLYEQHLAAEKWKFVVTLDEAWVYLSDCNKKRSIFYRSTDGNDRTKWVRQCTEKFPKGFMIVAGFCYNGKLKIKKVSSKAKINSLYYQQNILEPIFEEEIPALYGKDIDKVELHMDKASSHTSKSTASYLAKKESETGIKCIPFNEIPVKSPDASPMDFCAFGLLKRALGKRHPRTLNGLWKTVQEEWGKIDMTVLRKSLLSWKIRARAIVKNHGYQIEANRCKKYGIYT